MTKRTLLRVARRIAQTAPGIASDMLAIAEYSRDDEQREWLAYVEMCRYTREGQHEAADALWRVLYPDTATLYAINYGSHA